MIPQTSSELIGKMTKKNLEELSIEKFNKLSKQGRIQLIEGPYLISVESEIWIRKGQRNYDTPGLKEQEERICEFAPKNSNAYIRGLAYNPRDTDVCNPAHDIPIIYLKIIKE